MQKYGGVSRYFNELITRLNKKKNIETIKLYGFKGKLSRMNSIMLGYNYLKNKFNIYHPTYYSFSIKKKNYYKTIITVFDMIHELYLKDVENFKADILMKKQSILNSDHIICISNNTKEDLKKIYRINDDKISVIYLGSPAIGKSFVKKDYKIPNKPFILYVGKRSDYKNFNILLQTYVDLNIYNDFNLICFGGGEFSVQELIEFEKFKIDNFIYYREGSDELLQYYYENAFVFVYPSLYEGFGLPILEAFTFGCPVIASNVASIPEIAGEAALLFSPDNIEELSKCLKVIINENKTRNDFIEKGKKRSKAFNWDNTASETVKIYQKILNW